MRGGQGGGGGGGEVSCLEKYIYSFLFFPQIVHCRGIGNG